MYINNQRLNKFTKALETDVKNEFRSCFNSSANMLVCTVAKTHLRNVIQRKQFATNA